MIALPRTFSACFAAVIAAALALGGCGFISEEPSQPATSAADDAFVDDLRARAEASGIVVEDLGVHSPTFLALGHWACDTAAAGSDWWSIEQEAAEHLDTAVSSPEVDEMIPLTVAAAVRQLCPSELANFKADIAAGQASEQSSGPEPADDGFIYFDADTSTEGSEVRGFFTNLRARAENVGIDIDTVGVSANAFLDVGYWACEEAATGRDWWSITQESSEFTLSGGESPSPDALELLPIAVSVAMRNLCPDEFSNYIADMEAGSSS